MPDIIPTAHNGGATQFTVDSLFDAIQGISRQMAGDMPVSHDTLLSLVPVSALAGITVALILFLLTTYLSRCNFGSIKLGTLFVAAWLFSFVVYDIGMCMDLDHWTLAKNAPMAMLHAFGSFLLSSDVSEIHNQYHSSPLFMCLFSVSHALSAGVSTLFILKVFGFNLLQRFRMFTVSRLYQSKQTTYVLWGIDSATYKMAESIKAHYADREKDYRLIVVKTASDAGDKSDSSVGFNKIFGVLSMVNSELEKLQGLKCLFASSSRNDLNTLKDVPRTGNRRDILRQGLRLRSLARILEKKTRGTIHMLFLSEDDMQNIHDVSTLLEDTTLGSFANSGKSHDRKVIFHCRARYNSSHRAVEDLHCNKNMEVRVIDASHINVEMLKRDSKILPVDFVDVNPDGTVSSDFNAMVIGFGEVGMDTVRFLYEFAAFAAPGGNATNARRSGFHLDAIDKDMRVKAGLFINTSPAIQISAPFAPGMTKADAMIELCDLDCRSMEFYDMLGKKIKKLNYVVLATGDDELNMSMGVRIFKTAIRRRENLDNFCILIRIHDDDDGHYSRTATYYNRLWKAQQETTDNKKGDKPNTRVRKDAQCELPLHIFGQDANVYTYDNIIDHTTVRKAKEYMELYEKSTRINYDKWKKDNGNRPAWDIEQSKCMQTDNDFHPAYACLMKLRRSQGQNIANSLHTYTKEKLAAKALIRCGLYDFRWDTLRRRKGTLLYSTVSGKGISPRVLRLLTVMAQTEHLRWNASHEILGYIYDKEGKDETRLHHGCLTGWDMLDDETRSYDHNVVDLALGINITLPEADK